MRAGSGLLGAVRVEFDANRLNEATVAALLRGAGLDLRERVALI